MLIGYLLVAEVVLGNNSQTDVYRLMFDNVPILNSIRSLHRFVYFQLIILFVGIYAGLSLLTRKHKKISLCVGAVIAAALTFNLYQNHSLFNFTRIPQEYFEAVRYLKSLPGKKIYFPSQVPLFQGMSGNYTWLNYQPKLRTAYINPLTSIFSTPNLIALEEFPLSIKTSELLTLTSLNKSPEEIIQALETHGIEYLILDENYLWGKNYPDFNIENFIKATNVDRKFGSIVVIRLKDKSGTCKLSYGDFRSGYCTVGGSNIVPQFLINRTKMDYLLDLIETDSKFTATLNRKVKAYPYVGNIELQRQLMINNKLIPFTLYQTVGQATDIFKKELVNGSYVLFVPILKTNYNDIYKNSQVEILLDGKIISSLSPLSEKLNVSWEEIQFEVTGEVKHSLSVSVSGKGFIVLGAPVVMALTNWNNYLDNFLELDGVQEIQ